jgi:hypothetical protein
MTTATRSPRLMKGFYCGYDWGWLGWERWEKKEPHLPIDRGDVPMYLLADTRVVVAMVAA